LHLTLNKALLSRLPVLSEITQQIVALLEGKFVPILINKKIHTFSFVLIRFTCYFENLCCGGMEGWVSFTCYFENLCCGGMEGWVNFTCYFENLCCGGMEGWVNFTCYFQNLCCGGMEGWVN
jgi:hypothetical protein